MPDNPIRNSLPSAASQSNRDPIQTPTPEEIQDELEHVLSARGFEAPSQVRTLLRYLVEESLAGRADGIKAYTIAVSAFDRTSNFDPQSDPIVRVQARRLRRALERYYLGAGRDDPVRITVPTGAYIPVFERAAAKPLVTTLAGAGVVGHSHPVVAVLPFRIAGDETRYRHIATGFGEQLATHLAKFRSIRIIAQHSTLEYEGRPVRPAEVRQDLGAGFAVFGGLEVDADQIRIRVQLVNTASSEQVWAEEYDGKMTSDNVLAFRDEVICKVVAMIGGDFGAVRRAVAEASRGKRIVSMNALEATMLFDDYQLHVSPSTFDRARRALEHAVDIDPEYAAAWAALAIICLDSWVLGFGGVGRPLQLGLEYARRAYRLDPTLQLAAAARAYACSVDGDQDGVIHAARRVVSLNPNDPVMVGWAGFFLAGAGEYDEGAALVARARELNPHAPHWWHATDYFRFLGTGDYGEALKSAYAVESYDFYWGPLVRTAALGKLGRETEARDELDNLMSLRPGFDEDPMSHICGLVSSRELAEEILDGLYMGGLSKR